jgi:hypothetical protein
MTLLANSSNNNTNNSAGDGNGTGGNDNNNNPASVVQGLILMTQVNFFLHLMFILEFAVAGEQFIGITEFLNAVVNKMEDEDTINPAVILAALEHILAEGLAEEQDDGTYKLTEVGRGQFGDHGPVSEAEINKVKGLCLPPPQYWLVKELANNGGEMDQGELERRFNEYWGVEEAVEN